MIQAEQAQREEQEELMNGELTVWCVQHRRRIRNDGEIIYHDRAKDRCTSKRFRIRRERQAGPEQALRELTLASRIRP